MSDGSAMTFGQMLAEGMRAKRLDYRTLAKLVGVSHGYLWQLVNAEKRALNDPQAKPKRPSESVSRAIAAALDLEPRTFLIAAGFSVDGELPLPTGPVRYTTYPATARQLYQDGLEASTKGHGERAVALLEAALEAGRATGDLSFVNAHAALGMAHYQAGRHGVAIQEFDAALMALATGGPTEATIAEADLAYNRGLAYQRQARELAGAARAQARRKAAADFRRAIALEGDSQDLYHSALCYLFLESGHPRRLVPFGRAFLHRQAVGPTRHTTAALDVQLFLAFAQATLQGPGAGVELADVTLQLCPEYWYAHFVKATLLALQTAQVPPRRREACLRAGLWHAKRALTLHPPARGHFAAERAGDFAAWAAEPDFLSLLAPPEDA